MKKLLLIASALLAFTFFGCDQPSNSTTPDTGKSDVVAPDDSTGGDETTGDDTTGDDTTGEEEKPTEAKTKSLGFETLASGYGSSYDAATKTITFEGDWKVRGWWLDTDLSSWKKVVIEYESEIPTVQLVVEYDGGENDSAQGADGKVEIELDEAKKNVVKQIYLQGSTAGTVALISAILSE